MFLRAVDTNYIQAFAYVCVCVVDNLYVTEETTTWANISKNCQLARPDISINEAGHVVVSDHDFIRLYGRLNESLWINYFWTYGTFEYIGKIYLECVIH